MRHFNKVGVVHYSARAPKLHAREMITTNARQHRARFEAANDVLRSKLLPVAYLKPGRNGAASAHEDLAEGGAKREAPSTLHRLLVTMTLTAASAVGVRPRIHSIFWCDGGACLTLKTG